MADLKTALTKKALATVEEATGRLLEVQKFLREGEELTALGALSGLGQRLQYVETLLMVLRDVQSQAPGPGS